MIEIYEIGVITFITSLFCLGLREVTDEVDGGRIGYPIRKWFIKGLEKGWMKEVIAKPIILCCSCMASFWGSLNFWFFYLFIFSNQVIWQSFVFWIISCIIASYLNTIGWVYRQNMVIGLKNIGKEVS